jgi:hypothetical protein
MVYYLRPSSNSYRMHRSPTLKYRTGTPQNSREVEMGSMQGMKNSMQDMQDMQQESSVPTPEWHTHLFVGLIVAALVVAVLLIVKPSKDRLSFLTKKDQNDEVVLDKVKISILLVVSFVVGYGGSYLYHTYN